MRVTIGICTRDRAELLRQTLDGLTRLAIPQGVDWDLLIVDNGSTDATADVVAAFRERLPTRFVTEPVPGVARARNRVLAEAEGDYLLCTDDDVLVDERWLATLVLAVRRYPGAACFGGPVEAWFPVEPDARLLAAFPMLRTGFCGLEPALPEGPLEAAPDGRTQIYGPNMAFRVEAVRGLRFDDALGYKPGSLRGGEEGDFVRRLRSRGGAIVWVPAMKVRHYVDPARMTLRHLTRRHEGLGEEAIFRRGIPPGPRLLGAPRWLIRRCAEAYLRHWRHRLLFEDVAALAALRRYHELRGMIRACRERSKEA
jgi:glycosyltransferase involved in cell wall biosynthesis